ncbi:MHYT domain-containing protein, NO-binding membrane sensor [Streptomyces sp. WMMB 714]|jgi:NO-binding membrane sensor protein with MHYT domain|uniref:MHYT domain-containing protein n=1 Tax=Streptomyces sp. WMMB 714 TaxID=1286822 RepID=UPI000823B36D|nr:MHYT domain-containing protein [Streptomyces sp. WMMB 714]SCK29676.1 MHYT domain-containing protein, NO-binding membrane sensor [Streptomyces sp. WMMB 714]
MTMLSAASVPANSFTYGLITPAAAYAMATLGSAVGLRCAMRARAASGGRRAGWLVIGSVAIGFGIFTMHFVAMAGFSVGVPIQYDMVRTLETLGLAVLVSAAALFLVGSRLPNWFSVPVGGIILGLGVASTHFLGMTGMQIAGIMRYDTRLVAISAGIAVAVTVIAMWCATRAKHLSTSVGSALIMGLAFTGMHYTAMNAMTVNLYSESGGAGAPSALGVLTPVLVGPMLLLTLIALFVSLDPMMEQDGRRKWGTRRGEAAGEKLEWTPFERG